MTEDSNRITISADNKQKLEQERSVVEPSRLIPTFYQNLFANSSAFHQSFLWNQAFINAYKMYNSMLTQNQSTSYLRHYSQVSFTFLYKIYKNILIIKLWNIIF